MSLASNVAIVPRATPAKTFITPPSASQVAPSAISAATGANTITSSKPAGLKRAMAAW